MNRLIAPGTIMPAQSMAGGTPMTMTTTGTTEGSQDKQTTLRSAKAAKTPWCSTKRCIDGARRTSQEDVRKMWERAWTNHTLEKSKRDHHGAKVLSGPPHPPKEGRQGQCNSWWKSTVSFRSPVECTLDDQLLDLRGTKAKAKAEKAEMERK